MEKSRAVFTVIAAIFVHGCVGVNCDPADLKFVLEVGTQRSEVLATLGEPVQTLETDDGRVDAYWYHREICNIGILPIYYKKNGIYVTVGYARDGSFVSRQTVVDAETSEEAIERYDWKAARESRRIEESRAEERRRVEQAQRAQLAAFKAGPQESQKALVQSENLQASKTKMEAEKALFAYATLYSRQESGEGQVAWQWLCLAANLGNSEAQSRVAHWLRSDIWKASIPQSEWVSEAGIQSDNRAAYMWYTLAARNGDSLAQFSRSHLEGLTEEDISQAEQMVQNWEPGQCPRPN
jgi:hypothetical protein